VANRNQWQQNWESWKACSLSLENGGYNCSNLKAKCSPVCPLESKNCCMAQLLSQQDDFNEPNIYGWDTDHRSWSWMSFYGAVHLCTTNFVQVHKIQIRKVSFVQISYPSCRNGSFDQRNLASKPILLKLKTEWVFLSPFPKLAFWASDCHIWTTARGHTNNYCYSGSVRNHFWGSEMRRNDPNWPWQTILKTDIQNSILSKNFSVRTKLASAQS